MSTSRHEWLLALVGHSIGASAPIGHKGLKTPTQSSIYRRILWNPGDKWNSVQVHLLVCGGKGHEEGGLTYAKAGSSLRSLPGNSRAIYPQNQSLPTFCFVLSPTPLTLRGAVPHYLSEKRVSLQLQLIIPGCDSVSTYKLPWKSSSLPE